MRSAANAIVEVLSTTKEIGQLVPGRRVRKDIGASGLVQYATEDAVLLFNIEGAAFQTERLYKCWLARSQGPVNGKRVYMAGYCCGKLDRQYYASCSEFIASPHVAILDYIKYCIDGVIYTAPMMATFTLSPQIGGFLEGRGSWIETTFGGTLTQYYKVTGYCFPVSDEEGNVVDSVMWWLEHEGRQYNDGPILPPDDPIRQSVVPVNTDIEIYGILVGPGYSPPPTPANCFGPYYWTGLFGGPYNSPAGIRLRVY